MFRTQSEAHSLFVDAFTLPALLGDLDTCLDERFMLLRRDSVSISLKITEIDTSLARRDAVRLNTGFRPFS